MLPEGRLIATPNTLTGPAPRVTLGFLNIWEVLRRPDVREPPTQRWKSLNTKFNIQACEGSLGQICDIVLQTWKWAGLGGGRGLVASTTRGRSRLNVVYDITLVVFSSLNKAVKYLKQLFNSFIVRELPLFDCISATCWT